jgi:hypothetical protein
MQYIGKVPASDTNRYEGDYGNELSLGGDPTFSDIQLTPSEAWSIDAKLDDGLPATGKIATYELSGANCSNITSYNISYTSQACSLVFKNMW